MKYQINTQSSILTLILFMTVLFIPAYFMRESEIQIDGNLSVFLFAILAIAIYFLVSKLTTGRAEIILNSSELSFHWVKRPIVTLQKNTTIKFDNIIAWKHRKEAQYDYFKIYTKNEGELIFYPKSTWKKTDNSRAFIAAFKSKIKEYNKENSDDTTDDLKTISNISEPTEEIPQRRIIDKEEEYSKSGFAKLMFYVYIITVIFGSIALIIKWDKLSGAQPLIKISGLFSCLFLINQHLQKQKKL